MNRSIATNAVKNYNNQNYKVEIPCPQCSAPVILEETDRILTCRYCRTRVALIPKDYFRYCILPRDPKSEQIFYVPYWRLRGLYFYNRNLHIENRMFDTSVLASPVPRMTYSLGVRCQTLTLKSVDPEMEGLFFQPKISKQKVIHKIENMVNLSKKIQNNLDAVSEEVPSILSPWAIFKKRDISMNIFKVDITDFPSNSRNGKRSTKNAPQDISTIKKEENITSNLKEFIGETISMIYFPVYLKNKLLYDGVLKNPISSHPVTENDMRPLIQDEIHWTLDSIPLNCPECGWELPGERDSIFFYCPYCSIGWLLYKDQFRMCSVGIVDTEKEISIYMPFWKMVVEAEGLIEKRYTDQMKRNFRIQLDGTKQEATATTFWAPAFKLAPDAFINTARNVSVQDPKLRYMENISKYPLFPVTLPASEALESVRIVIALLAESKENVFHLLPNLRIRPKQAMVVYLPFKIRGIELIQQDMQLSFFHSAIRDSTRITDILK
ncbi:hypothetical protein JW824_00770 [bacterium]|nr:hypothetical protein [bacterium]RQV98952.1 MAG: hypothetical protein EH221_01100 [bacterium]